MSAVSRSLEISAPADLVWSLVTDLPRMGEYSPENTGGKWVRGKGPEVGAVFRGINRRGRRRWTTWAYVTAAEPPTIFSFRVGAGPLTTTIWSYLIEPTDSGCLVTESWEDRRGPLIARLGDLLSAEPDRASYTGMSIEQTLARLKARAEA